MLVAEWENNGDVAVEDPDELSDEVQVQREVDHGENKRTWKCTLLHNVIPIGWHCTFYGGIVGRHETREEEPECEKAEEISE